MDLFIIIAAVLGAGGVVTAAIYGLVNGNASTVSMQFSTASVVSSASNNPLVTVSMKNTGSASYTCSASSCVVTLSNLHWTTAPTTCNANVATSWGPVAATASCSTSGSASITLANNAAIPPGGQFTVVTSYSGGVGSTWTAGITDTIQAQVGPTLNSISIVGQ
jgi:hypothetical protein